MQGILKRWMLFVDGENFTIRSQEFAKSAGLSIGDLAGENLYSRDNYFWPKGVLPLLHPWVHPWNASVPGERAYYYTILQGDELKLDNVRDALKTCGFESFLAKKSKGQRAKGVDIALTKDMLVNAFYNNYDVAVLVSGDGDYVPVVEELKRMGKIVIVAFYPEQGLNPKLRRAADRFQAIELGGGRNFGNVNWSPKIKSNDNA